MFFPIEYDNIAIYVHLRFFAFILKFTFGLMAMQIICIFSFYFLGPLKKIQN